jgi:hypothetical protein
MGSRGGSNLVNYKPGSPSGREMARSIGYLRRPVELQCTALNEVMRRKLECFSPFSAC